MNFTHRLHINNHQELHIKKDPQEPGCLITSIWESNSQRYHKTTRVQIMTGRLGQPYLRKKGEIYYLSEFSVI